MDFRLVRALVCSFVVAVFTGLTAAFVASLGLQQMTVPASSREEAAARAEVADRLVRAAKAARADGEDELARWIEALPAYPKQESIAALP